MTITRFGRTLDGRRFYEIWQADKDGQMFYVLEHYWL